MPLFTVGVDPVSCPPHPTPSSLFASVCSPTPLINPELETSATSGRRAVPCMEWRTSLYTVSVPFFTGAVKIQTCFGFFSPLLQRDTGGTSRPRKSHLCMDLPVLSAPPCTEVRPFQGRWRFSGPQTLKSKTERNAGWSCWCYIQCLLKNIFKQRLPQNSWILDITHLWRVAFSVPASNKSALFIYIFMSEQSPSHQHGVSSLLIMIENLFEW